MLIIRNTNKLGDPSKLYTMIDESNTVILFIHRVLTTDEKEYINIGFKPVSYFKDKVLMEREFGLRRTTFELIYEYL